MRIIDWSSDVCSSDLSHKWEGDSAYDAHALHGFAHDSIARGSKSFALASQLFDRETRERVWLLYAWCRAADDLTDGPDHGGAMKPGHDQAAAAAPIRPPPDQAVSGRPTARSTGRARVGT